MATVKATENTTSKTGIPGFVYLIDDERDLKFGITSNINRRKNEYVTENPRSKCVDYFQADSLAHAEQIEAELMKATKDYRTHGKEWSKRCDEVFTIWNDISNKYAKRTYEEWMSLRWVNVACVQIDYVCGLARNHLKTTYPHSENKHFHWQGNADITICETNWFDGTWMAAGRILFNVCRKFMEQKKLQAVRFDNIAGMEDLVVLKKEYFDRLQKLEQERIELGKKLIELKKRNNRSPNSLPVEAREKKKVNIAELFKGSST